MNYRFFSKPQKSRFSTDLLSRNSNLIVAGAAIVGVAAIGAMVWRRMQPSASTFITEAYAKGVDEIALAELALQKSHSHNVKVFAQHMIDDHTSINKELRAIAERKNIHLADDTTLISRAKTFLMKHKEGQSFDEAYADHQLHSHKHTVALFRSATKCKDTDTRYFAAITINKLNSHLKMAERLLKAVREYRTIKPLQRPTEEASNGTNFPLASREGGVRQQHN